MKKFIVSIGCTAAILMVSSVSLAQGKGGGASKPKVSTGASVKGGSAAHGGGKTTHAGMTSPAGKATGPRLTAQGGAKAHGPTTTKATGPKVKTNTTTAKTTGPKTKSTTTTTNAKATGPKTKSTTTTTSAKSTGPKSKSTTTTTTASTSPSTSKKNTTTVSTTGETLTPVQQKLQRNTNLASKLEGRLPKGTDLMDASEGFRNLGQFVAAVNASYNHDLDFDKLKIAMVDDGMSLGQAMKDQRTSLDGTVEATRAQREADVLIRDADAPVVSSAPKTTTTRKPKDRQ